MKKLSYKDLVFRIHDKHPKFSNTDALEACEGIIGQKRAINAIVMGLDMKQEGYNIFISGMTGTGRNTTIKKLLDNIAVKKKAELEDKVFVHNFKHPEQPIFIALKAGEGIKLKKYMHSLVKYFIKILPATLKDASFKVKRNEELDKFAKEKKDLIKEFQKKANDMGFDVSEVEEENQTRTIITPVVNKKPVTIEQFEELAENGKIEAKEAERIMIIYRRLTLDLEKLFDNIARIDERLEAKIESIIAERIGPKVNSRISDIEKLIENVKVKSYLDSVGDFVKNNPSYFFIDQRQNQYQGFLARTMQNLPGRFYIFDVNVITGNAGITSPPVLIENSPTVRNLFGTIEKGVDSKGNEFSSFLNIKPGSLIQADGGYLVIDAEDMFNEGNVYHLLKRTLKTKEHTIQPLEQYYFHHASGLKPESIPLNVKVILIGSENLYDHLDYLDDDFSKIFKVKAQFDTEFENNLKNQMEYGKFIKMLCTKENLKPLDFSAFEQVLRFSSRLSGNRQKLSTQFTHIADLIREADYFAQLSKKKVIEEKHIRKALKEKEYMHSLSKEKMLDYIKDDTIIINTKDVAVGQINGLVVQSSGDLSFGMPARITVSTSIGEQGIVNIEREAELSGAFFDKAVLIIDGYLRKIFAQDKPLSVNVSLAFEQSYGQVEGDSASQAEIIAILSSLSQIPIKQYLAITGSVNQFGEIQPIGGVNEKIEGFFNVCRMRGLQKDQGVIIPARNVKELILKDEILEAVDKGLFTIWAVDRVEESVELMMGVESGKIEKNGAFTPGSVYDISNKKLWEYANTWKKWSNAD